MTTTEQMYLHLGVDLGVSTQKVERLREKLGTKAKQEKNFKFYSLYGHICNMDVLKVAWKGVKENKGAPGVDRVSIESLNSEEKVNKFLLEIQTELINKTYKPNPVRREYIPKANGKLRPLGIPCLRDRVVQTAACLILEPIFEADFLDCSYGFRPGRSQHQALKAIPYGIYDITWDVGWVNVGIDHDTGEFAVESIRKWWFKMGKKKYPKVFSAT